MSDVTPMMKQYLAIKKQYSDAILFFRLGDFYEMFFEDAKLASSLLDLTLTSRNKNQDESVPLCGVPYHSAQSYIHKLLLLGHKVAICEQTEDPKKAKGIVKREVVQVLTPSLVLDPQCLEDRAHHYLVSISYKSRRWGLAYADISTGSFQLTELYDEKKLIDELMRLEPKELLVEKDHEESMWVRKIKEIYPQLCTNVMPGWHFDADFCNDLYKKYYKVDSQALGLLDYPALLSAGGALLSYLSEKKFLQDQILSRPEITFFYDFMVLDHCAKQNLELLQTISEGKRHGSLIWLLDCALTSMGSRQIRDWLLYPLIDVSAICKRHDVVQELTTHPDLLTRIRSTLESLSDLERIQNRILACLAHPRDLKALRDSFHQLPSLLESLEGVTSAVLTEIRSNIDLLEDVCEDISRTIIEDPPLSLKEGGIIQQGVNAELDALRDVELNGKSIISSMEAKERETTGISSLKIRYNRVFGYYIEITHTHKDKVPNHYRRKQTLTNAERYITEELKEYEDKVLSAGERIKEIEYDLFVALRQRVAEMSARIKKTGKMIAHLDAFCSLAVVALENRYIRPSITLEPVLQIHQGRHPLVELIHTEEVFVPNDLCLNTHEASLLVITGPNMAGKSTVMRQAALIVLMAQMGSFVPAASATIGIVDRIFTRIGASDSLQKGQSTFMVEMLETAHILAQATQKSLIILDEIGRGTSTFDGLSIAWAVAEDIHDRIRARTLFATHYHELTDLQGEKKGIKNYHMAIKEWNGEIKFLRELREGGTNRSYGVHVASMAGLPASTIKRAKEILKLLEQKDLEFQSTTQSRAAQTEYQPSLFEAQSNKILEKINNLEIEKMTPLDALNVLAKIQKEFS